MMGGWRGEAASSFMQVHDAFEQQANKINDALRQITRRCWPRTARTARRKPTRPRP